MKYDIKDKQCPTMRKVKVAMHQMGRKKLIRMIVNQLWK